MRIKLRYFVMLFVGLTFGQAHAKEWPAVGWFEIIEDEEACGAFSEYSFDGRSDVKLGLILGQNDIAVLTVNSSDWSAKEGIEYPGITYSLNGYVYSDIKDDDGKLVAVTKGNTLSDGTKGFIRPFLASFLDDFAKGSSLLIKNGDSVITHVNLHSSGAAVQKLRECVAYVKRQNEAQKEKEQKWDYIDKDPFAAPNAKQMANQPVLPRGNPGSWVSTNDYPAQALQQNREGITAFRLVVGPDGRPTSCSVTESSGHADLDQATCSNAVRRGRFNPATDANSKPTTGHWSSRVRWQIPTIISPQTP